MRSLETLGSAQFARNISLPTHVVAPLPAREIALEGLRQRNAVLDYLFYDLGRLTPDEAGSLAPRYAREGAILKVEPSGGRLDIWADMGAFAAATGASGPVAAIAVAGVGSSALGAAAFARNVADALDAPVIAVVSGYGLADLLTEALGGFFLFGQLNALRHVFEPLDDLTRPGLPGVGATLGASSGAGVAAVRRSLDVKSLIALLQRVDPGMLIGHSKGNLVVSEALFELRDLDPGRIDALAATTRIVTVSARIAMPRQFADVIDVMGAIDGFGELNSRPSIPTDVKPFAWHHTNTEIPFHLPVTKTLLEVLAMPAPAPN